MTSRITLLALALTAQFPVQAATFCVANSAELAAALDAADSNGANDDVRVRSGSFTAPVGGFRYEADPSDADNSLVLSGGWNGAGCVARTLGAGATLLTGIDQRDVLHVMNLNSS
ncbi:MAG: hypothetical protein IT478_08160, partial [Xanthomonadales bacterium]|nr:hypothetical protein [Xanthomonadales bacterium]